MIAFIDRGLRRLASATAGHVGPVSLVASGTNIYISGILPDSPPVSDHRVLPAP
jgi:hypothetical protein